jgi:hypothetical protein
MFADAEECQPELVGEDGFFDDMAQHGRLSEWRTITIHSDIAERIKT